MVALLKVERIADSAILDKTMILMTNGSLLKVERIADSAMLLTCIK